MAKKSQKHNKKLIFFHSAEEVKKHNRTGFAAALL